jgi:hypothetical protein
MLIASPAKVGKILYSFTVLIFFSEGFVMLQYFIIFQESIMLKFVISYTTNNETITEMGEISNLLLTEPVD